MKKIKLDTTDNPFPINLVNYNLIELSSFFDAWLPLKSEKPLIIEDKRDSSSIFIYANNYFSILSYLEELDFNNIGQLEMIFEGILDFASFQEKDKKINAIFFGDKYSKTFYFEANKQDAKMLRYIKSVKVGDENKMEMQLNLLNRNNYLPIEKRNGEEHVLEKFYYIDEGKIFLSFNLNEDLPFEVYKENCGFSYKDYLIPQVKTKRSRIYLPSFIEYDQDGDVLDFQYHIDNKDLTDKAIEILDRLNIVDPVKHQFTEDEIKQFHQLIFN